MSFKPFYVLTKDLTKAMIEDLWYVAVEEGANAFCEDISEAMASMCIGVDYEYDIICSHYPSEETFGTGAIELTYEQAILHIKGEKMNNTELEPFYVKVGEITGNEVYSLLDLAKNCGAKGSLYFPKVKDGYMDLDSHLYFGVDYNLELAITEDPADFGINPLDNINELTYEQAELYLQGKLEPCTPDPTVLEEPISDDADLTHTFIHIRDSEHSEAVQEYLFSKGYRWWIGGFTYVEECSGKLIGINGARDIFIISNNDPALEIYDEVFIDYEKKYTYTVTSAKGTKVSKLQKELEEAIELANKLKQEIDDLLS